MSTLKGKQVLVVDDDPMVRFIVSDDVRDAGAEVAEARDGLDALQLIDGGLRPDALVTDVRMPRLDGWSLAEQARERLPALAVLYVTGYSDVTPRPVAGSRMIEKPFPNGSIGQAVAALVGRGR